jgi:hypothetical protein
MPNYFDRSMVDLRQESSLFATSPFIFFDGCMTIWGMQDLSSAGGGPRGLAVRPATPGRPADPL